MSKCDIVGCDEEATLIDDMDNVYCEDCMEKAVSEEGRNLNDFESIPKELR